MRMHVGYNDLVRCVVLLCCAVRCYAVQVDELLRQRSHHESFIQQGGLNAIAS